MYYIYKLYFDDPKHCYIGQTNDIDRRFREHTSKSTLARSSYKNNWIKKNLALNKKLNIKILDAAFSVEELDLKEIGFISHYRNEPGFKLYNLASGGHNLRDFIYPEDIRLEINNKISLGNKGKPKSKAHATAISKANKGKKMPAHHTLSKCKEYKLRSPNGSVVDVINLKAFAASNSLDYKAMLCMCNGKVGFKSCKGWTLYV